MNPRGDAIQVWGADKELWRRGVELASRLGLKTWRFFNEAIREKIEKLEREERGGPPDQQP